MKSTRCSHWQIPKTTKNKPKVVKPIYKPTAVLDIYARIEFESKKLAF